MITLDEFREQLQREKIHAAKLLNDAHHSWKQMDAGTLEWENTHNNINVQEGKIAMLNWIIEIARDIETPVKPKMREFI